VVLRAPRVRAAGRLRASSSTSARRLQVLSTAARSPRRSQQETGLHLAIRGHPALRREPSTCSPEGANQAQADARRPGDLPEAPAFAKANFAAGWTEIVGTSPEKFRRRQARGRDDPHARLRRAARAHVEAVDRAGAHPQMVGPERLHAARLRDGLPHRGRVQLT